MVMLREVLMNELY